jgi:hypothetical protein
MCVLISSTRSVWNISHSKKNWVRYDQKCVLVFMYSPLYACPILTRIEFYWQFFAKYPKIKFYENPFSVSRVTPCGWTDRQDRHDEANSCFSQFCECASKNVRFQFVFYVGPFLSIFPNCWHGHSCRTAFERDAGQRETLYVPPNLTIRNSTFCVLFMYVRTNSDSFPGVFHCCCIKLLNVQGCDAV